MGYSGNLLWFSMYEGTLYIKGEEERYNSQSLVSRGLQEGPVKNPTQKIQNTLTSWGRNI